MFLTAITKQLGDVFPDHRLYIDRVDQEFEIPAFYVYSLNTTSAGRLRSKETRRTRNQYSFAILYKNAYDKLLQADALTVSQKIEETFDYLRVEIPETDESPAKERLIQISSFDSSLQDIALLVTITFTVDFLTHSELQEVLELEKQIIVKKEE